MPVDDLLDKGNATTEHGDAVAHLDSSFVFAPGVPFLASAHQEIEPSGIETRSFAPERNARSVPSDEEITTVSDQSLNSLLDFLQSDGQHFRSQAQGFRIGEFRTESLFMFHDRSPEANFAVNATVLPVLGSAQMIEALAGINSAGALHFGNTMGRAVGAVSAHERAGIRYSASRYQWSTGQPRFTIQRSQPRRVPLPDTPADDRRDVIGNSHFVAGSGSDSGALGSGCSCGGSTGGSRGSTMMVRSGSPICIIGSHSSGALPILRAHSASIVLALRDNDLRSADLESLGSI